MAIELGEATAVDGEGLPCERETGGFVGGREVLAERLHCAVHLEIDGGSTDGGEAFELPLGVGERGDEFEFGDGLGLPLRGEVFEVLVVFFFLFAPEDDTGAVETVRDGVAGRDCLAFGGLRAPGLLAVEAGRQFLRFRSRFGHKKRPLPWADGSD